MVSKELSISINNQNFLDFNNDTECSYLYVKRQFILFLELLSILAYLEKFKNLLKNEIITLKLQVK